MAVNYYFQIFNFICVFQCIIDSWWFGIAREKSTKLLESNFFISFVINFQFALWTQILGNTVDNIHEESSKYHKKSFKKFSKIYMKNYKMLKWNLEDNQIDLKKGLEKRIQ